MSARNVEEKVYSRMRLLRKLVGDIVAANRRKRTSISVATMLTKDVRLRAKGPTQMLEDLVEDIVDLNLQKGISDRADAKLQAARRALDGLHANDNGAAVAALKELISAVEAQQPDEGGIPRDDAQDLIDAARAIVNLLTVEQSAP